MARFYGIIGYAVPTETSPGVWEDVIVEKKYYGDVTRDNRKLESSDELNDNITISNIIRIVADPYAEGNFHAMRYIVYMNAKWKIKNVTVEYPRLRITTGGVYSGK